MLFFNDFNMEWFVDDAKIDKSSKDVVDLVDEEKD